jgi:hypothetical protein
MTRLSAVSIVLNDRYGWFNRPNNFWSDHSNDRYVLREMSDKKLRSEIQN